MDNYVDTEFLEMDIKELLKNPKLNNDEYMPVRNSLIEKCEAFIQKCEELNTKDLPAVKEYYENYVSKIDWYRVLHEEAYRKAKAMIFDYEEKLRKLYAENKEIFEAKQTIIKEKEEIIRKYEQEKEEIIKEKEEIIKEKEEILRQNEKINTELIQVYNSRGWKLIEKIRKIKSKNN